MRTDPIDELRHLFLTEGHAPYSEEASHLGHAAQCAFLAEREGSPAWLVAAALTHDIGYLLAAQTPGLLDEEGRAHEDVGARWLALRFDPRVGLTVASHVLAKRFLCTTEPGYMRSLPIRCRRALAFEGGPMCAMELEAFGSSPIARQALQLRRWEERAMRAGPQADRLEHFLSIARLALLPTTHGWP